MADRPIIWGEPGEVFRNDGDRPLYQFVAALQNTCGACLQYHMAIGPHWPIPIHRRCRCRQYVVRSGAAAPHAFVDFRALLDGMPHHDQVAAIGASNYALLRAGVVSWSEVVTKYRVRTFREVVALNKVSEKTALAAGVRRSVLTVAYAEVNAPEAQMIREHRARLTAQITAAAIPHEELVRQIAESKVNNVAIVGSSGVRSMADVGPPPMTRAERIARIWAILAAQRGPTPIVQAPTLPAGAVVTARGPDLVVRVGEREIVVRPGGSAYGVSYDRLWELSGQR